MTVIKHFGQTWKLGTNPGRGNQGLVQYGDRTIEVDGTISVKEKAVEILIHEVVHNIGNSLGIELSEDSVVAMTTGILSFLLENGVSINPLWKLIQQSRK